MSMEPIMGGLFLINGTDIWTEYGVFLTEEKRGGRDNLKAILAASKTKAHTAVDIREENGEKYSDILTVANEARDITLQFAIAALPCVCSQGCSAAGSAAHSRAVDAGNAFRRLGSGFGAADL